MNNFEVRKISHKERLKRLLKHLPHKTGEKPENSENSSNESEKNLFSKIKAVERINVTTKRGANISIFISIAIIIALCFVIVKILLGIDFKTLLLAAGEDLKTDGNNHTNILILGTGNENHEGADLTDTIIMGSMDNEKKMLSLISIPRDLYVKNTSPIPSSRINEVYFQAKEHFNDSTQGLSYLVQKVEEITDLKIQYYVKINFNGFKEIIDILGGIDVDVPESIYDPFYPKGETHLYEIFSITKGLHHMDGETALKYARSRETSSDFSRSNRQQQILYAIKEKAAQADFLLNKGKIQDLLTAVQDNIETNLTTREILTFGGIFGNFTKDNIVNKLIHDNPVECGGFLYQPPLDLFDGAFVLIPAGGESYLKRYFNLATNSQEALKENYKIQVLNGTHHAGVAAETKQVLKRYCFNISRFGNSTNLENLTTTIYYKMEPLPKKDPSDKTEYYKPYTIDALKKHFFPTAKESTDFPQKFSELDYDKEADIIVELGQDYVNSDKYIEDPFYALYSTIFVAPAPNATPGDSIAPQTPGPQTPGIQASSLPQDKNTLPPAPQPKP